MLFGFCTFSIPDKIECLGGLTEVVPLFCSYLIKWEKGEEQDKENKSPRSENLQDTAEKCNFSYHRETEIFRQLMSLISMSCSPNKNFIIKRASDNKEELMLCPAPLSALMAVAKEEP